MPEQAAPTPVQPRTDLTAGDIRALQQLGLVDAQPVPSPDPPPSPLACYDATA
ncbi:hypothetical protein [Streptomyces ehimensis]|uniref:Uncharacterized protein n=1 Tax=Streptomyces ehimensis TaxID=68195 RepID=A0ABV9BES4_9ACTN